MRRTDVLIAGGGPAGCAAAIVLARGGARPLLVDRGAGPRDVVCGGFLGWDALSHLRRLGIDPAALGARPITRLRLLAGGRTVEVALPHAAAGLSRRTLDSALLQQAQIAGATLLTGRTIRESRGRSLRLDDGEQIEGAALFIATGKHELRGSARSLAGRSLSVGLRAALPPDAARTRTLEGVIELYLFDSGYAGLLLQEDGTTNLGLSVETERLAQSGSASNYLAELAAEVPELAARIDGGSSSWKAVAGVPYGWRAATTSDGTWRLGDQAAVIASLAGDGVAIALASGVSAASAYHAGQSAADWQRAFARRVTRPVRIAETLRHAARRSAGQRVLLGLAGWSPALARIAARLTRVG